MEICCSGAPNRLRKNVNEPNKNINERNRNANGPNKNINERNRNASRQSGWKPCCDRRVLTLTQP